MNKLDELLVHLERFIPESNTTNKDVSAATVGWHIEHILLVLDAVAGALLKSNPGKYKWSFNVKKMYVLTFGKLPRGKIKAPTVVQPASFNIDSLQQHLSETRKKVQSLETIKNNHFFTHPFLGDIKLPAAKKFMYIHTRHHIHIIDDIVNANMQ